MTRVAPWGDAAAVAFAKAALSLCVLATGFVALSDDDYSRTVIAERFARAPSLDPSGTSWLPLPFFIHGAVMTLCGRSLSTAHATAIALGVLSALSIHRAARWLGLSRPSAGLAALVASGLPTAAELGVSAQPEALTAGLVIVGAAATRVAGWRRVAGAAALFAACLCRYEAWAAAGTFALVTTYDATRGPGRDRREAWLSGAIAVLAPILWIVHGAVSHGDALFFLHRVAAYRRALGVTEPMTRSLIAYPAALFRVEPEVTLAAVVVAGITRLRAPRTLGRWLRPALPVLAVLLFLVAGRVQGGAPTHHEERTLLPVWTFLSLIVADGIVHALSTALGRAPSNRVEAHGAREQVRAPSTALGRARAVTAVRTAAFLFGVGVPSVLLRNGRTPEPGAPRSAERALGLAARRELAPGDRLLVDTGDYGYFAVIAAFGAPERAEPLDPHDPRQPREIDVFATEQRVESTLRRSEARWLVVQAAHLGVLSSLSTVVARAGDLSLVRVSLR